jgi:hypothetical protein
LTTCWSPFSRGFESRQSVCRWAFLGSALLSARSGGKREDFEKFRASVDVAQNKYGYTLLRQTVIKLNLFKYNGLCGLSGIRKTKKKGDPKNEGKSKDMYENKGQEKNARESL